MAVKRSVRAGTVDRVTRRQWGHRLAAARLDAGYRTHKSLADALGSTEAAVSAWERGVNTPRDATKRKLAALLHTTVAALFPLDDDRNGDTAA